MDKKDLQNMAETKDTDIIDLGKLIRKIWDKRKLFFFKIWPITFVLSCFIILCVPRYYSTSSKLAPEMGGTSGGGMLGSIASSFGINLDDMEGGDAINPMLYPELMEDNGFVSSMFSVRVTSIDGEIDTDYYTYLKKYQKRPWWSTVQIWITRSIKSVLGLNKKDEKTDPSALGREKSPYWLSEDEENVANAIRGNILFSLNDKTGAISISTKAQDPLVAKILADSVQIHLQQFITEYRTNKARIDLQHFEKLCAEALNDYEEACDKYSQFYDAHKNVMLATFQTKRDNLEKDMQLKYQSYSALCAQLEMAKSKVQEKTPAFTLLKGASVEVKPAGPKCMLFVIFMLVFVTAVASVFILRKDLLKVIVVRES